MSRAISNSAPRPGRQEDKHFAATRLTGIALVILSACIFAGVGGISKMLVEVAGPVQIVWARYALALPVLLLTVRPRRLSTVLATSRPALQIVRGLLPVAVSIGMVVGVSHLPLADATVILFAAPLIVVALSSALLGEQVRGKHWVAVAVGFLAVLIVARPGFNTLSEYALYPVGAAVFYALLQIATRRLAVHGERPATTLTWTLLIGTVLTTPFALAYWQPLGWGDWMLLVLLGLVFGMGQLAMIAGFAKAAATLAAPFTYTQIVAAVVFGSLVFQQLPDFWTFLGFVLIGGSGIYVALNNQP